MTYLTVDFDDPERLLVTKMSEDKELLEYEAKVIRRVQKKAKKNSKVPRLVIYGNVKNSYFIIQQYYGELNLE